MKKAFNKIKTSIAACGIAIITFLSKAKGEILEENIQDVYGPPPMRTQTLYGSPPIGTTVINRIVQPLLILIAFIIGIINLIKLKKIDDKVQKKKKIKRTIIAIGIIIVIIIALLIGVRLWEKYQISLA